MYGAILGSPTVTPIHEMYVLAAAFASAKLNPWEYMLNKTLGCPTAVKYGSYTYPLTPLTPSSRRSATKDCPYVVSIINERPPVETAVSAIEPSTHVI